MTTIRLGAACGGILMAIGGAAQAAPISGQGTWETTLQGRDLDGDLATFEAYYDTVLDITWLANVNHAGTVMTWANANAWASSLNPYGSGITGWRLPTTTDTGTSGCNFSPTGGTDCGFNVDTASSEMAHMFFSTLGNLSYYSTSGVGNQPGWGLTNTGPFSNLGPGLNWSAMEYAPSTSNAWYFDFGYGSQDFIPKTYNLYAWAVHAGDVGASAVPVPAAVWLLGSGIIGLIGMVRGRREPVSPCS